MKQLKEYIKKNTLLGLAICMTLSSIAWGCSACEPEEEKDAVKIELEGHKGDIEGNEEGTLTFLLKEGSIELSQVVIKITNHKDFVKADGTALSETMTLLKLLGKSEKEDEQMGKSVEVKVKAAPATITAKKDVILKMAVGDEDKEDAFVSEKPVVSWKATTSAPSPSDLQINATFISPNLTLGTGDIHEGQVLKVNLSTSGADVGKVKCSEIMVEFNEGTYQYIYSVSDPTNPVNKEFLLSKQVSLDKLLRVDPEEKLSNIDENKLKLFFKIRSDYKNKLMENHAQHHEMMGTLEYNFICRGASIPSNNSSKHKGEFTFKTGSSWRFKRSKV